MKSSKDIQKELEEREYFKIFARSRELTLTDGNFENRCLPEPDILYRGELEVIAFELTNCLEREIQHDYAKLSKGKVRPTVVVWADPFHCQIVLKNKLSNCDYQSSHPMELVMFYGSNGQTWAGADNFYVEAISLIVNPDNGFQYG